MNLGDVKIRVKRQFGDEAGVQITDADIVRWVNDAQRDIVMNHEDVLEKLGTADAVAGQIEYVLPTDLFVLRSVSFRRDTSTSYNSMQGMSLQQFDQFVDGWDGPTFGNGWPQVYHVYEGKLKVWPAADTAVVAGFKVYYSRKPLDRVNDIDEIDLPIPYHNAVVSYCLQQAYELDEDLQSAAYKKGQFTESLLLNKEREKWTHRDAYPVITVLAEDAW